MARKASLGLEMSKVANLAVEVVEGVLAIAAGAAFAAIMIPVGLVSVGLRAFVPREPYSGENTYGFKDGDFVRMHFPGSEDSLEEGHLTWVDFTGSQKFTNICSDRLFLWHVSKGLRDKWQNQPHCYDTGRLEYFELATAKDNDEIKKWLYEEYKPDYAEKFYQAWLKRLGGVNVSA